MSARFSLLPLLLLPLLTGGLQVDLLSEIDTAQLACLNCKNKKALARVFEDRSEKFNPKAEVLESDAGATAADSAQRLLSLSCSR